MNLTGSGTFGLDISLQGSWKIELNCVDPVRSWFDWHGGPRTRESGYLCGRLVRGCMCVYAKFNQGGSFNS